MSDFDEVLERLLLDPRFKAALAVDPAAVLAGYRLTADERALLISDLATRHRRQSLVERRASGRVVFGLAAVISEPAPAPADPAPQEPAPATREPEPDLVNSEPEPEPMQEPAKAAPVAPAIPTQSAPESELSSQ